MTTKLKVTQFSAKHATAIASWPASAHDAQVWAGEDTSYPLYPEEILLWHKDPEVIPLLAYANNDLVAYGELWVDQVAQEVELARIIVAPECRGHGVGRRFVSALVDHAETFGLASLFIRVHPQNVRAMNCYVAADFVAVSAEEQETFNQGQSVDYVWLKYGGTSGI